MYLLDRIEISVPAFASASRELPSVSHWMIAIRLVLATVNGDALGSAVTAQSFVNEAFCCIQITFPTEVELDRIPVAVNGAVQIHPFAFYPYAGLVQIPFPTYLSLPAIEAFK